MSVCVVDKEKIKKLYSGKRVLILGIGVLGGGYGVAKFFNGLGAIVTATDLKKSNELNYKLLKELKRLNVRLVLGKHREKDILNSDLIIRNPSIPKTSLHLKLAKKNNIPVTMEAALFSKLCPLPIIGVTGSRGKTTTVHMLAKILSDAGYHTVVGGNIPDNPTLPLLWKINKESKVILELSSWALNGFKKEKISPHISIITNIYPDHLNRYKSMSEYVNDKKIIYEYQSNKDYLILNKDNRYSKVFAEKTNSKVIYFSAGDLPDDLKLRVPGKHNRYNGASAVNAATMMGIAKNKSLASISEFSGTPYRLQLVKIVNGIKFINDSASTTPTATLAALNTYKNKSIILMIGGASKNLSLDKLINYLKKNAIKKYVFLSGNGTDVLIRNLIENNIIDKKHRIVSKMDQAVRRAYNLANKEDIVLLSPGFTSFSGFKNEFERGDQFNNAVRRIKLND